MSIRVVLESQITEIMAFVDAIVDAEKHCDTVAVLLGNGFSIDYDSAIFHYDSLADEAELKNLSVAKEDLFKSLGSRNFEVVVDKLAAAAELQLLYGGDPKLIETLKNDAAIVRNGLADVVAKRHPDSAQDLTDDQVLQARTFLSHFDRVFTLSYDLLLYWVDVPYSLVTLFGLKIRREWMFG